MQDHAADARVWRVDDRLVLAMSVVERGAPVLADAVLAPASAPGGEEIQHGRPDALTVRLLGSRPNP